MSAPHLPPKNGSVWVRFSSPLERGTEVKESNTCYLHFVGTKLIGSYFPLKNLKSEPLACDGVRKMDLVHVPIP